MGPDEEPKDEKDEPVEESSKDPLREVMSALDDFDDPPAQERKSMPPITIIGEQSRAIIAKAHYRAMVAQAMDETVLGRENEVLSRVFKDTLFTELLEVKASLPPELKALIEAIEPLMSQIYEEEVSEPEDILARRSLIQKLLYAFENEKDELLKELPHIRKYFEFLIAMQKHLIPELRTIVDEDDFNKEKPDPITLQFFNAQLAAIIDEISENREFDFLEFCNGKVDLSELPENIQLKLLFPPFEALARLEGILPHEAMDSRKNRLAIATALRNRTRHFKLKQVIAFYHNVTKSQREKVDLKDAKGRTLWKKYVGHRKTDTF